FITPKVSSQPSISPVASNPTNTCNGFYNISDPSKPLYSPSNFGDPKCEYANNVAQFKNNLYGLIQRLDPNPKYVHDWFDVVIPGESSYNPNAYLKASTSGKGAYGLVQMNPHGQGNNQYDDGEVYWQTQMQNGINE